MHPLEPRIYAFLEFKIVISWLEKTASGPSKGEIEGEHVKGGKIREKVVHERKKLKWRPRQDSNL